MDFMQEQGLFMSSNNTYILLHGAWHASWCWKYITPLLQQAGHKVIEHDFAGHGKNQRTFDKINLKIYTKELINLIHAQNQPVILVAHSFAGVIASQVAEQIPDLIQKIIYIAAFVPENNSSLMLEAKHGASNTHLFLKTDVPKNQMLFDLTQPELVREIFFHLCTDEDFSFALAHLQIEPLLPMAQIVKLSADNFGRVPKQYIACTEDKCLDINNQLRMAKNANISHIIKLPADHSPFFSMPHDLLKIM